jgi:hypothetical protein
LKSIESTEKLLLNKRRSVKPYRTLQIRRSIETWYHVQHVDCASIEALVKDGDRNDADVKAILGLVKGGEYLL